MATGAPPSKTILRELTADLIKALDPDAATMVLFSKGLLTDGEKEKVDSGRLRTQRNNQILDALRRREPTKALHAIIEILEGEDGMDKEANSEILHLIETKYPPYSYENGLTSTDNPTPTPPLPTANTPAVVPNPTIPTNVHIKPLPELIPRGTNPPSSVEIKEVKVTSSHDEGTDGPSKKDRYQMNSVPRGYCIIINNVKFSSLKDRAGSNWDADALQKLFGGHLGFHVERYDNLDSHRMLDLMKNLQQQDHSALSCLVVAILTHGVNGEVYGTDGRLIKIDTLTNHFSGRWCPTLVGKPKVFILQACRGGAFDYGAIESTDSNEINESEILDQDETDGGGYSLLPENADFILAYATTPGFVSWRNSAFGTWFVKAFVDTMYEKADTDHLMDNLVEVNRIVAEEYESRGKQKQMPAPVTTLRYKLYLPPLKTK